MRDRKYRIETLSFYDHSGIEKHLSGMARKGWMIQRISNGFWTYRRMEPRALHFAVTYFPKASEFDPGPSQAQQTLIDFCTEAGWSLACTWFQMQVFFHDGEDPTPIHTEPALEVAAIHRACWANYLRIYTVLFAVSLVFSLMFFSSLISDMLRMLASPMDLMTGTLSLLLFLFSLVELTAYYRWRRKAKKAADRGMFLDTPSTAGFQRILLIILCLCLVYWLASELFVGNSVMVWTVLAMLLCIAAAAILSGAVKRWLKRKRASSGANRALTSMTSFAVSFVLVGAVISFSVHIFMNMEPKELPLYAQPPLRAEDLVDTGYGNYITTTSPDESLFLTYLGIHQRHGFGDEASAEIPELKYELYGVKIPSLYGFCKEQLKRQIVLSAFWGGTMVEQDDAAFWGALEAYRLVMDDGTQTSIFLLCYKDRLARLEFSWEPTREQMGAVGERLTEFAAA